MGGSPVRRVAVVVILAFLVSACGLRGATPPPSGAKAGPFTLVWGKETDPAGITPLKAGDIHSWEIFSLVYEPLTVPKKKLNGGPGLAEWWKQTSDTSGRFRPRRGVKFSNGRPLTADDVVGTWNAYKKLGVLA